jgi:hypothetical protein
VHRRLFRLAKPSKLYEELMQRGREQVCFALFAFAHLNSSL